MEFERNQLEPISRVAVEQKSPIEASAAGRFEVAQMMYQRQELTTHEFLQVLRTGDLETKWRPEKIQERLIKEENEALRSGQSVVVMLSDPHHMHIQRHLAELATQTARGDQQLVSGIMEHVQEHMRLWREANVVAPGLLAVLGVPDPPPMQPPGLPGPPPQPSMGPPAAGPSPSVPGVPRRPGAPASGPLSPAMPQTAPNPGTGIPDAEGDPQ